MEEFIQTKLKDETSAVKKLEEVFFELMKDCFKYRRMSMCLREIIALNLELEPLSNSIHEIFISFFKEGIKTGEFIPDFDLGLRSLYFGRI